METVGQLTGGVAHDFNNLLTVITNSLDLLEVRVQSDAQTRRIIDSAQRAAERGARLTGQLLAFSRRQPLRPEICNINGLIEGFEAVLRRACPEPIEFEMIFAPRLLAANIDSAQFETALLNLVINARDAMPNGGTLRISTSLKTIAAAEAKRMSDELGYSLAPSPHFATAPRIGLAGSREIAARLRSRSRAPDR